MWPLPVSLGLQPVGSMPIVVQLTGSEVLDTAAARSLVVGQPQDKPNLCTKHGSKGKGKLVLLMFSFRGTME